MQSLKLRNQMQFRYLGFRTSFVVRESSIGDQELEGRDTCQGNGKNCDRFAC